MEPFISLKDKLKSDQITFKYLDAVQLIFHAFGLITEGRRKQKSPHLVYLFAEPVKNLKQWNAHREEIVRFSEATKGAEVGFTSISYREWLATWPADLLLSAHRDNILKRFEP